MSVAVLVYSGVHELELGVALTVCLHAGGEGSALTTARSRATITAAAGLVTTPQVMFAALEPPQAVIVPSGPGAARAGRDPSVKHFLQAQHARGIPIAACGSGVLCLGEAGLLLDREVGTSPELMDTVWGFGPAAVKGDLTEDAQLITGSGGLNALQVALRVAQRVWGESRAAEAARRLGAAHP